MTTEFENLAKDFVDWLDHPLTKKFVEILEVQKSDLLAEANELSFKNYHKRDREEIRDAITLRYGKADGIATILSFMANCKDLDVTKLVFQQTFKTNEFRDI